MKNNIKSLLILTLSAALILSGCKISIGKATDLTEVSMTGITSMAADQAGNLYILSDEGLSSYALSGDKKLTLIWDAAEISEAAFNLNMNGEDIEFGGFIPEFLYSDCYGLVSFAGRYSANDAGRDRDLFVLQGTEELNSTAMYYDEIDREYGAKTPAVNGIAVTDGDTYLKLNRHHSDHGSLDGGLCMAFGGAVSACPMPDGTVGALAPAGDDGEVTFLVNDGGFCLERGGETVYAFDGAISAFVQDGKAYAVYADGRVNEYDGGKEKELLDMNMSLKPENVGCPFLWDGKLYWFDGEGVKTARD